MSTFTRTLHRSITLSIVALLSLTGSSAWAEDHEVVAVGVKFDPMFVYVEPGDTVTWTGMAAHNVETIDTMSPDGFEKVNSELGENVTITFDQEGIVVYKCTPHWGARMGGVIVVGKPENPVETLDGYLASLETDRENLPAKGLIKKVKKDMEKQGLL